MIFKASFLLFSIFVIVSSYWIDKEVHLTWVVLTGAFAIFAFFFEKRFSYLRYLQIAFLGLFHLASQLNWCLPLYFILLGKKIYIMEYLRQSVFLSVFYFSIYAIIRISYSPNTLDNYLDMAVEAACFLIFAFAVHYLVNAAKEKQHFIKHDPLTGLLNFQEYHKQLQALLKKESNIILVLIDCTDLKSMNIEQGVQGGNRILQKVAQLLKEHFSDSFMIARYGGDEFALATKFDKNKDTVGYLKEVLDVKIPKLLGIQLTYGYAVYPDDGESKDDLISIAEKKMFSMKREIWLKREEHILRAEKLSLIGEFAAGMAHEIRNPLTTIKGFIQVSKQKEYNIKPWYELIMSEIERMSELTAEFLQFAKPHVTHFKIQSLQKCVQRAINLMESKATLLGHQIHYDHDPSPIYVLMDKDKMVQLLLNLVKNAFEAMDESGLVSIRLYHHENKGIIEVEDTGSGIPQSDLPRIFHPFYTTKENGTGLGLSICHKIVQDHGGNIDVIKSTSDGTIFRISLPLAKTENGTLLKQEPETFDKGVEMI